MADSTPANAGKKPARLLPNAAMPGLDGRVAMVFAALGEPTRLRLVTLLCTGGALSIAQLTAASDISRQGVTKHLQVLADAGVVHHLKVGRERRWQLEPLPLVAARQALEQIGAQWDLALHRLKTWAESDHP